MDGKEEAILNLSLERLDTGNTYYWKIYEKLVHAQIIRDIGKIENW